MRLVTCNVDKVNKVINTFIQNDFIICGYPKLEEVLFYESHSKGIFNKKFTEEVVYCVLKENLEKIYTNLKGLEKDFIIRKYNQQGYNS